MIDKIFALLISGIRMFFFDNTIDRPQINGSQLTINDPLHFIYHSIGAHLKKIIYKFYLFQYWYL